MNGLLIAIVVILVLVALNAFFSLAETALTGASRARMATLEKEGDKLAARVNRLNNDREGLVGAVLLGANAVTIGASVLAASIFGRIFGENGPLLTTIVLTPLLLIFGEVLPKSLAIGAADKIARLVAIPVQFIVVVFKPFVLVLTFIVRLLLRMFGVKSATLDMEAALDEIRGAVELGRQDGNLEKGDRDRLGGVLDLDELDVSDVMVHRNAMKALNIELPARELIAQLVNLPHSRVPIWKDEPENIIGILYARDLLGAMTISKGQLDTIDIEKLMKPARFVPDTTTLKEQLERFLKERTHMVLVVDEYGALQGLVTLEDILEEIVGDIMDEHDVGTPGVRPLPDGSVYVDGWVPVRDLNRAMEWDLPDEDAVTLAGLIMHESQTIPDVGQQYRFFGFRFHVMRKERHQIKAIHVRRDNVEANG